MTSLRFPLMLGVALAFGAAAAHAQSAPLNRDGNPGIDEQASLEAERVTFQVRNSILSNLAFISVLLAAGCWYVARSDF